MTSTTLFIWDGLNLLLEEDAGLIARVQWTNFPDEAREVLVMRQAGTSGLSNGASFFPGFDLSGNTRLMVGAAGISKWRTLYESFGEERALVGYGGQVAQSTLGAGYGGQVSGLSIAQGYGGQVGSTFEAALNHLRFGGMVGYYTDPHGLIYVRQRIYDPRTGRWLSPDPIEFASGWNPYGYAFNDPINFFDPEGAAPAPNQRGPYGPDPSLVARRPQPSNPNSDETLADVLSWYGRALLGVGKGYSKAAAGMAVGTLKFVTGIQGFENAQFFGEHGVNRNSLTVFFAGPLVEFSQKSERAFVYGDPEAFGEVWLTSVVTASGLVKAGPAMVAGTKKIANGVVKGRRAVIWLKRHEKFTTINVKGNVVSGHTIKTHIRKSPLSLYLRTRPPQGIRRASSYFFRQAAAQVISQTVRSNRKQIGTWLSSNTREPLRLNHTGSKILGYGYDRQLKRFRAYRNARVVLIKSRKGNNFIVYTSFPQP